jgi:hypothetical protein
MNKLYSQIASLIVVVGLGTAWAFGVIDVKSFTTISVTVLSAIFALYQKYEKDEVVAANMKLEDNLKYQNDIVNKLRIQVNEGVVLNSFLNDKLNGFNDVSINKTINETEIKPKRTRKPKVK